MLIRIVKMTFYTEEVENFLHLFNAVKDKIKGFEGCTHLELWRDKNEPNSFVTYSHWESEEALNGYRNSPLFEGVWAETKAKFSDKPIAFSAEQEVIV